jgi:hypothetical protein
VTSQSPTQQWGPPQPSPAPPTPPPRKHGRRTAIILASVAAVLGLIAFGYAVAPTETATLTAPTTVGTDPATGVPENEDAGAANSDPIETETTSAPDKPPVAKVGQTLTMTDGFGDEVAEITVGGLTSPSGHKGIRFSTGGEYDNPEHGLYMGVWVKVTALADGVDTVYGDLHVAQGGQHYPGDACCPDGFNPTLDYATLSDGETSQGWVVFDLRSRNGEIVIADYEGKRIGAWKF